jgi:hypothetical protein
MKTALAATLCLWLIASLQPARAELRVAPFRDGANRIFPGDGDYLVVLHGWTTGYDNLREARAHFRKAGYYVVGLRYPSRTAEPTELLKKYIRPGIAKYCTDQERKIHFLTHSLGGVLLREYLKTDRPANLGRVVMLAPPNHGTELVDRIADRRAIARFIGPTALRLNTGEDSWPKSLGKVDFPVGIIMGSAPRRFPLTSKLLPGSDDGIVSIESGKLDGMSGLIQIPAFHTSLPDKPVAWQQAQQFIEHGRFAETSPQPAKNEGPLHRIGKLRHRWHAGSRR